MRTTIATLLLLFLASVSAPAAPLSLKGAVERALSQNRGVKSQTAASQAEKHLVEEARSAYLPSLVLSSGVTTSTIPSRAFMMKLDQGSITAADFTPGAMNDPSRRTDFSTAVTLRQPLYDRGVSASLELAKSADRLAQENLQRYREETALAVFRAYVEVRRARERLTAAEEGVKSAREQLRLASVRVKEGAGLKSDELRARTWLSGMEQQRIAAGNRLELARLELARLIGEPGNTAIETVDELPSFQIPLDRTSLLQEAREKRADLKARETAVEQARISLGRARGEWFPTLYATAGYQMNGNDFFLSRDNDGWFAGAALSWELFDGMRRSASVERASRLVTAAEEGAAEYRDLVDLQVRQAILSRDETGKRLEAARHALLDAEEAARLVRTRYQNSLALFIELLDAEANLTASRAELADAEAAHAVAGAEVLHAAGIFLPEVLK